jgi:hypothetical protein
METIAIISLTSIIIILSFIIAKLRIDSRKIAKGALETLFENELLIRKIEEQAEVIKELSFQKNDGFVTFLSQSRDWAFQYIEEVQTVLDKFVETVKPTMEYYDKFGRINESTAMNIVFDAYTHLIEVLPETENNKENNE